MNEYRVSIIVPVYNGGEKVIRCIKSIQGQSFKSFECIVIDDGSTDLSYNILSDYLDSQNDDRFRLIRKNNTGVADTRNYGISISKGDYIAFIDQDDRIKENYLYNYVNTIGENDILVGGYERINNISEVMNRIQLSNNEWSKFIVTAPWAHLYKKSFLIDNNIKFLSSKIGEDVYFNIVAYSKTKKIGVLQNDSSYQWIYNEESVSNSKQKKYSKAIDPIFLMEKIYHDMDKDVIPVDLTEYYFVRYAVWYVLFIMSNSEYSDVKNIEKNLFKWIKSYFPHYEKNRHIKRRIEGEPRKIFVAVKGYSLMRKIGILNLFLKINSLK